MSSLFGVGWGGGCGCGEKVEVNPASTLVRYHYTNGDSCATGVISVFVPSPPVVGTPELAESQEDVFIDKRRIHYQSESSPSHPNPLLELCSYWVTRWTRRNS